MSSRVINKFAFHSVSTQNEIYQVQTIFFGPPHLRDKDQRLKVTLENKFKEMVVTFV